MAHNDQIQIASNSAAVRGMFGIDILGMADDVKRAGRVEYRDAFSEPYGDDSKTTRAQRLAWAFLKARQGTAPIISMIGAKGSAKTHFGSAFAFHQGQMYPNSMGCVISNTYSQAKNNAGALFIEMARRLGYNATFRNSAVVGGRPYDQLFIVDLDGTGFSEGQNFYMLVRSFEAVNKLEGIELDWLWVEEIQDAAKDDFVTVLSRVRGKNADLATFIAGMPHDEFHWQYAMMESMGCIEESKVRAQLGIEAFDATQYEDGTPIPKEEYDLAEADVAGVFFEPCIFENRHNLDPRYIQRLYDTLDPVQAQRWIFGRRTAMRGNRVVYNYDDHAHRLGRMSRVLAWYDENLPIILTVDFNTSPMCATVHQIKGWNDHWNSDRVVYDTDDTIWLKPSSMESMEIQKILTANQDHDQPIKLDSFESIAAPDRDVLVQVDEFEVWEGGTRGLMRAFIAKYGSHPAMVTIIGDATGNREDTRSGTTDWRIIEEEISASGLADRCSIIKGLQANYNYKLGVTKYTNPVRRDTINVLNAACKDSRGRVHLCFLPESELKSGGAAAAVSMIEKRPDGVVDDRNDKKEGIEVQRTHFFDCIRYVVWHFRGGNAQDLESFQKGASRIEEDVRISRTTFGHGETGGGSFFGV